MLAQSFKYHSLTHSLVHDRLGLHADLDVDGGESAHEVEEDVGQVDVLSDPVILIEGSEFLFTR